MARLKQTKAGRRSRIIEIEINNSQIVSAACTRFLKSRGLSTKFVPWDANNRKS